MITIAVLSDTHGLLRPEIPSAIKDVDHIIHAGDLGKMEILDKLNGIAPTSIVRGNVDTGAWAASLPYNTVVDIAGHQLYVLHDIDTLDLDPQAAGFAAVIYGHSHQPEIDYKDNVLYLNPGSIGPRRFKLPVSYAMLRINDGSLGPELIEILT
jgi:putative phosphoesterase